MIIEEDAVEAFLEHHGVKGQKWGIRNTGRTISRKAKKAAGFISKHKEVIGTAAAGAAFAVSVLADKKLRTSHPTKSISRGSSWLQNNQSSMKKSAKGFTFVTNSKGVTSRLKDIPKSTTPSLSEIQKHLKDPTYVWKF